MAHKRDGTVYVDTLVDTKGFNTGVNNMQKSLGGLTSAFGKLGLAIGAAFGVTKLVQFGKEAIELGSDLEEVQNVVDVTFNTMSDKVNEFAKGAAEAAGLSETMAKRYVGTFGAMAKAFGFAENESYDMATALTQLAGDVSSFYNITQDEAYTKLKSAFTGEVESLKDLGVVMTQSALDSFAMAKGWGKTTAAMKENEKVALRYAFVMEQLNAASGDFIRTQDSWANQTKILSLNWESFKANIGQGLIDIFTPLLEILNRVVEKMVEFSTYFKAFAELIMGKQSEDASDSLKEVEKGFENITDATEDATNASKKYLSGLDEIRTFTSGVDRLDAFGDVGSIEFDVANSSGNTALSESTGIVDSLIEKIEGLKSKFPLLTQVGTDAFELFSTPFEDNKQGFLDAISNTASAIAENIPFIISKAKEAIDYFSKIYNDSIKPVIDQMTADISDMLGKFIIWYNEDFVPVLDEWGNKFQEIWEQHLEPFMTKLGDFITGVSEDFELLWNEVLKPIADWITEELLPAITPAIEELGNLFLNKIGSMVDAAGYLLDVLGGVISFLTGVFTGNWDKAWEGLKEIFVGFVNFLAVAIEDLINTKIIWPINQMIGVINGIGGNVGMKEVIPVIPEIKIPYLATGAVIPPNAPFMAMLGDQKHGNNIETPEHLLRQIMREELGGKNGGQYQFTAQINRRTLFEEMIDEARLRQTTTGRNPFELG